MAEDTENVVQTEEVENAAKEVKAEKKAKKADKAKKPSWFKGLKAEFKKIVWPDRKTLAKQIVAVIVCSLALGVIIAMLDVILKELLGFIV